MKLVANWRRVRPARGARGWATRSGAGGLRHPVAPGRPRARRSSHASAPRRGLRWSPLCRPAGRSGCSRRSRAARGGGASPADPREIFCRSGTSMPGPWRPKRQARPRARARPGPRRPQLGCRAPRGLEERTRGGACRASSSPSASPLPPRRRPPPRRRWPGGRRGRRAWCRRRARWPPAAGPFGVHGRRRVDLVGVVELASTTRPSCRQRSERPSMPSWTMPASCSEPSAGRHWSSRAPSSTRSGGREAKRSVPRSGRPRRPSPVSLVPAATRGVTRAPARVGQQQQEGVSPRPAGAGSGRAVRRCGGTRGSRHRRPRARLSHSSRPITRMPMRSSPSVTASCTLGHARRRARRRCRGRRGRP